MLSTAPSLADTSVGSVSSVARSLATLSCAPSASQSPPDWVGPLACAAVPVDALTYPPLVIGSVISSTPAAAAPLAAAL